MITECLVLNKKPHFTHVRHLVKFKDFIENSYIHEDLPHFTLVLFLPCTGGTVRVHGDTFWVESGAFLTWIWLHKE